MKFNTLLIILLLFIPQLSLYGSEVENHELSSIQQGIDLILAEKFDAAKLTFTGIIQRNGNHPLGYFALGSLYNAMTVHYETDIYNKDVIKYYSKAIQLADSLIKTTPDDPWLLFYLGSAKSNNGFVQGREGNLFNAVSSAYSGISYIEKCLEVSPDFNDAKMILGSYIYYKSSWTHWLYDRRDDGIAMIKESITSSKISTFFAISALTWIYLDYKKPHLALQTVETGLKKYPDSRYFLFGKARALFEMKLYPQAIKEYENLKKMTTLNEVQNNFDPFNCSFRIALCYFAQKNFKAADAEIKSALNYPLAAKERKRLKKSIAELKELQKKCKN